MLRGKGIAGNEIYREQYRQKIMGLNQKDSIGLLKKTFGLVESEKEILDMRLEILLDLYEKELELFDGIEEILQTLNSEKKIKTALASGSPMKVIEFVLKKFCISDAFEITLSGDCVINGKPAPDIYIETAKRLRVSPYQCVAIEDSINGIISATSAGMRCIAVPDQRIDPEDYPPADLFRKNIFEIRIEDIKSI